MSLLEKLMVTRKTTIKTPAATTTKAAKGKPPTPAGKRPAGSAPKPRAATTTEPAAAASVPLEQPRIASKPAQAPGGEIRYRWIAHAAYLRAEKRGFAPGHEIDDWLAAEADFLAAHGMSKG